MHEARERFRAYLRAEGMTVNSFSNKHKLTQSTVQRLHTGRTKKITPAVRKILDYAKIELESGITKERYSAVDNPRLRAALEQAWDGSPETLELLAAVIEAIGAATRKRAARKQP